MGTNIQISISNNLRVVQASLCKIRTPFEKSVLALRIEKCQVDPVWKVPTKMFRWFGHWWLIHWVFFKPPSIHKCKKIYDLKVFPNESGCFLHGPNYPRLRLVTFWKETQTENTHLSEFSCLWHSQHSLNSENWILTKKLKLTRITPREVQFFHPVLHIMESRI